MTITNVSRRNQYDGDGTTKEFAVTFQFYNISVYVDGALQTDGVDYSVSQTAPGSTGTVIFDDAPVLNAKVVIVGDTALTQDVDYVNNDDFPAESHEGALDRLTMIAQELRGMLDRSVRVPITADDLPELDFEANADTVIWVNAEGVPELVRSGVIAGGVLEECEEARDAALAAQAAAETAETNAETAETNAETAQAASETAQTAAEAAQVAAEAAQAAAEAARAGAETAETNAETAQAAAAASEAAAEDSATNSASSASAASGSAMDAEAAQSAAEAAQSASEAAQTAAEAAQSAAETAQSAAETAETNAETAETNAESAQAAAEAAQAAAETSEDNAGTSAAAAASSASDAEDAQDAAETAQTAAEAAQAAAEAAQAAAEAAQTGAETAETNAGASATAAASSATDAASSETNAETAETNAAAAQAAAEAAQAAAEAAQAAAEAAAGSLGLPTISPGDGGKAMVVNVTEDGWALLDFDTVYYTQSEVDDLLDDKSDVGHNHDDRYYTETEVNAALASKLEASDIANTKKIAIVFEFDGGGAAIEVNSKREIRVPFDCALTGWTILLDQSGSINFGVWKDTFANYPPTVGDSITGGHDPDVSGATKAEDTNITDWSSTAVAAGDCLLVNVDSIATAERATLILHATKS